MNSNPNTGFLDALAATRRTTPEKIHALDLDDVALTAEGVLSLKMAAQQALQRHLSGEHLSRMSLAEAVSLFAQHMFWNEEDGGLLLCAQIGAMAMCIPIAAGHWRVAVAGTLH